MKIMYYLADLIYGASRYPCGWFKPWVVAGDFRGSQNSYYQKLFFAELLRHGFKRTFWQLVFPGQVAGLVKKISNDRDGQNGNEYHVRFYDDGTIECELEVDRWGSKHWAGPRNYEFDFLSSILDNQNCDLPISDRTQINALFGSKYYSDECTRGDVINEDEKIY